MLTGDHPATARALADQVGLLGPDGPAVTGHDLPADDAILAAFLDRDGVVVARLAESRGHRCRLPEPHLRPAGAPAAWVTQVSLLCWRPPLPDGAPLPRRVDRAHGGMRGRRAGSDDRDGWSGGSPGRR